MERESNLKSSLKRRKSTVLWLLLLAIVTSGTAIRIEILNWQVGGFLPRKFLANGMRPKWREESIRTLKLNWRYENLPRQSDGSMPQRELAPEEEAQLERYLVRKRQLKALRLWIIGMGRVQYFLGACMLLLSISLIIEFGTNRHSVIIGVVGCVLVLIVLSFAIYRGYWTSAGDW
jgi:hypothetical protein